MPLGDRFSRFSQHFPLLSPSGLNLRDCVRRKAKRYWSFKLTSSHFSLDFRLSYPRKFNCRHVKKQSLHNKVREAWVKLFFTDLVWLWGMLGICLLEFYTQFSAFFDPIFRDFIFNFSILSPLNYPYLLYPHHLHICHQDQSLTLSLSISTGTLDFLHNPIIQSPHLSTSTLVYVCQLSSCIA